MLPRFYRRHLRTVLLWKAEILLLSFPCTFDLWEGEEEVEEEEEKEKGGG